MKHAGKARRSAVKLLVLSLLLFLVLLGIGVLAKVLGSIIPALIGGFFLLWVIFAGFTLYFFRDPHPQPPTGREMIVSPAHGKVDVIDEIEDKEFIGARCRRISIFLSVIDIHVQNAPVSGKVAYLKHHSGQFLSAMKTESAIHNENVYIGFESSEHPDEKIGVRLIAGVLARRIIPWVSLGDTTVRGERISLIQFGSRCDLYLPITTSLGVKLGQHVVGGETIIATRK